MLSRVLSSPVPDCVKLVRHMMRSKSTWSSISYLVDYFYDRLESNGIRIITKSIAHANTKAPKRRLAIKVCNFIRHLFLFSHSCGTSTLIIHHHRKSNNLTITLCYAHRPSTCGVSLVVFFRFLQHVHARAERARAHVTDRMHDRTHACTLGLVGVVTIAAI